MLIIIEHFLMSAVPYLCCLSADSYSELIQAQNEILEQSEVEGTRFFLDVSSCYITVFSPLVIPN